MYGCVDKVIHFEWCQHVKKVIQFYGCMKKLMHFWVILLTSEESDTFVWLFEKYQHSN